MTHVDAPSPTISPRVQKTEMGVTAHSAVLTMLNVTGGIWMLANADR